METLGEYCQVLEGLMDKLIKVTEKSANPVAAKVVEESAKVVEESAKVVDDHGQAVLASEIKFPIFERACSEV